MIFLVLEIQSKDCENNYSRAQAWVKTNNHEDAQITITERLDAEGFKISTILECEKTEKDDYFAPCKSLDAYICAEKEGIVIRYL